MGNDSRFFFVLVTLAAAIGIGNFFVYPFLSFKYTGLFFIPYIIALLIIGIPLLLLEFSLGQFFNKNVIDLFASVKKWFYGVGWLMLANAFIVMSAYAVILSWHIIYFFASVGLQWKNDAHNYFFSNVLQVSNGIRGFTAFSLPVFIGLAAAWGIIFIYIRKGFESLKKCLLITFPIFFVLMIFFLFYSLRLDNSLLGLSAFLKPKWGELLKGRVWLDSIYLAALSLGISFGIMHAAARKSENMFAVGNSFLIAIFKILIGIAVGFIAFSLIGFLSSAKNMGIFDLAGSGLGYQFTILSQALPLLHKSFFISILFFAFFFIFVLFGAITLAYSISHILVHKFSTQHLKAAIIVCCVGFIFGLVFIIKPGFYIMDISMHFISYNILIALLLESVAIGWFFEIDKIAEFINLNSSVKIGRLWGLLIRYVVPFLLAGLILFRIKADLYGYKNYPFWALLAFGIGTVAVPLLAAFLLPQKILDKRA